ncbi:unnamed protein product [Vitrella brassicaformis CCMP3155]|uniref:Uncharacterized protein n=1 Tax=Vitrella brassicaformis (strain CCMP3155) TaxID=1169540 RepID=A0A0G4GUH0_VITBC|nr:unnamed protein product [Vitrella brassicaformis CCMP3155]|eukprot:CEM34457.1 unnamed protein product [Vitrella brassicaformis CCMP3155]
MQAVPVALILPPAAPRVSADGQPRTALFFFWNNKDEDEMEEKLDPVKAERFKKQQEILQRRRNPEKLKEYYSDLADRRAKASKLEILKKQAWAERPGETAAQRKQRIEATWESFREQGLIGKPGTSTYEEPERSIPLPVAPFGLEKYDQGERFDLRSPWVESGWVNPNRKSWWAGLTGQSDKQRSSTKSRRSASGSSSGRASSAKPTRMDETIVSTRPQARGGMAASVGGAESSKEEKPFWQIW